MARLLLSLKGTFVLSCLAAILTGVAVMGFGAPPVTVVWVSWGGAILLSAAEVWARGRLGRQ
jgi:hypothetical protein